MSDPLTPDEMHKRARAAGLTIDALTQSAELAVSTFSRWKSGANSISLENYTKLLDVIRAEERRRELLARPMPSCCDVPLEHIPFVWPKIEGYVVRSLKRDECERYQAVDVFEAVLSGEHRLWVAYDVSRDAFDGFVLTQITQWPRARECRIWIMGGRNLRSWVHEMQEMIEAYARSEGCGFIGACGRLGWIRLLGYERLAHTAMRKTL